MPQFFDHTAFPEPAIVEVEAPVIDPIAAPNDDAPVATGTPHAMTAAEKQALEQEIAQLEEARRLRLREVHIGPPNEPEIVVNEARSMEPPPPMTNPKRPQTMSLNGFIRILLAMISRKLRCVGCLLRAQHGAR